MGSVPAPGYLPAARRCQRVAFSIFLCFFLRIRLRRFLISEPMSPGRLAGGHDRAPRGRLRFHRDHPRPRVEIAEVTRR